MKVCSKCKIKKDLSCFSIRKDRKSGFYSCCKMCKSKYRKNKYIEKRKKDPISLWISNSISWSKDRAKKNNINHNITEEKIKLKLENQKYKCFYCDIDFNFKRNVKNRKDSPTIDRIIPDKGYTNGNTLISCYRCNYIKSDASVIEHQKLSYRLCNVVNERNLIDKNKTNFSILYRPILDWKYENDFASKYFNCTDTRLAINQKDIVIGRFSVLPFYKELENDIKKRGARLINSYDQHRYIADLKNWYYDLQELTPTTWNELYKIPDEGPFILKGETNSKKYFWNTHMFAKDKKEAIKISSELQKDSLIQDQNIYIRKYVPLEKLCDSFQGLPISREYRFFVYKSKILSGGFYWSSHTDEIKKLGITINPDEVPISFLNSIINKIQNTELLLYPPVYYVIDVAKTTDGDWILIELNDGQMSGLSENNPEILYSMLKKCMEEDKDWMRGNW